jgi:Lrp/AsnC family transcriptional regulator, regulator for asnA, asnC and gidA
MIVIMVSEEDKQILSELRKNSREKVSTIAFRLKKPVSTVFEKVKTVESRLVKRYTAILDYEQLGFPIRVHVLLNAGSNHEEVLTLLRASIHTNTLLRVDNEYQFFAEMLFRNIKEVDSFHEQLEGCGVQDMKLFYVTHTLKHEGFMP